MIKEQCEGCYFLFTTPISQRNFCRKINYNLYRSPDPLEIQDVDCDTGPLVKLRDLQLDKAVRDVLKVDRQIK